MIINHLGPKSIKTNLLPEVYQGGVVAAFTPEEWKKLQPAIVRMRADK